MNGSKSVKREIGPAGCKHGAPVLSVCIVNYNTARLLRNCIRSIDANADGLSIEIIVVDNHSRDGSVKMVRRCFPLVKMIVNQSNIGYAGALNQAIEASKGIFLLILNSDTVILPGVLRETIRFMHDHNDAGIVGCKILNPDGTIQKSCRCFPTLFAFVCENFYLDHIFPRSRYFGKPLMRHFGYDSALPVDVVLGAFMFMRRETINTIGRFDECFFMYSEETDYCYRAKKAGWKVFFFPGASIIHFGGESTRYDTAKLFIELHKSHHRFIAKYQGFCYLNMVKGVLFLGVCLRFFFQLPRLILSVFLLKPTEDVLTALKKYGSTIRWYIRFCPNGVK